MLYIYITLLTYNNTQFCSFIQVYSVEYQPLLLVDRQSPYTWSAMMPASQVRGRGTVGIWERN